MEQIWKWIPTREEQLKKAVFYSACVHLSLVIISIIMNKMDLSFFKFDPKVTQIKSAVKVDVVGMPKYTVQELKRMKLPTISTKVKTPPPSKKPTKNTLNSADNTKAFLKNGKKKSLNDILKNISKKKVTRKIKKGKTKAKKDSKDNGISDADLNNLILEGNKLSKGTSLVGESSAEEMELYQQYTSAIPDVVRKFWKLPTYLKQKELNCRIRIYISPKGKLIKATIYKSSGDKEYDLKALASVEKVKNFPVPAREISRRLVSGDLVLAFPL
jgi:colicin import membrane protein